MQNRSYLAFFILGLTSTIHGMALPFLIDKFNLTLSAAGLLLFANSLGYLLASYAFPFLNKRHTAGRLLALSFLILGVSYALLPWSSFWLIIVCVGFFASLGTGTIDVGFNTLIASLEPDQAKSSLNWLHFAYSIGALLGPALLSRLLGFGFSWVTFYLTASLLAFLFLYLWRSYLRSSARQGETKVSKASSKEIYEELHYWLLLISIFIYVATEVALAGWVPTLLTSLGLDAGSASLGISVLWLGIALGRAFCARIATKTTPRSLLLLLNIGATLILMTLTLPLPIWLMFLMLFCVGLFLSAIFPLTLLKGALLFPRFPAENTAGLVVSGSFGAMVGPALLGLVGHRYSLQVGIAMLAALMIISTILIWRLPSGSSEKRVLAPSPKTDAKGNIKG